MSNPNRGATLVELIVALLLIEIAGTAALAAALTAGRLGRAAQQGALIDASRWQAYRQREVDSACVNASAAIAEVLDFPASSTRIEFSTAVRCGH